MLVRTIVNFQPIEVRFEIPSEIEMLQAILECPCEIKLEDWLPDIKLNKAQVEHFKKFFLAQVQKHDS